MDVTHNESRRDRKDTPNPKQPLPIGHHLSKKKNIKYYFQVTAIIPPIQPLKINHLCDPHKDQDDQEISILNEFRPGQTSKIF